MDKQAFFKKMITFINSVHQTTHEITKGIKSAEITPAQYSILEYIFVSQPVTLSQISDCLYMSMPNTSRELRKLGDKKLCEKITVPEDRRKQYIRLTQDGEIMMNAAFAQIEARFLQRIKNASEEELEEIDRALDILHTKIFL